jgi:hypothetical protein
MTRPANDEGPTVGAVAPLESTQDESPDSHGTDGPNQAEIDLEVRGYERWLRVNRLAVPSPLHVADHALSVIEGESKAAEYLARLQAQQADPDELALIVSMLYGATLRGFCRVIAKAIGGAQ